MPSKTPKQAKFMRAAAHDPKIAEKHGISLGQAREFVEADKRAGKFQGAKQGKGKR